MTDDPEAALGELLGAVPELDEAEQRTQLEVLLDGRCVHAPGGASTRRARRAGRSWDLEHGIVEEPIDVDAAFPPLD